MLMSLDGTTTVAQLADRLGEPWTERAIDAALTRLSSLELLDDGTASEVRAPRRLQFRPPFVVQFNLFDPGRILRRMPRTVQVVAGRPGQIVAALLGVGGLLALAAQSASLHAAMLSPLPIAAVYCILGMWLATTFLHELGHACLLVRHGGSPRRLGMMLFYLMPAFFCDVSDAWRLGRREQRVGVALAGIVTQSAVAGTGGLAATLTPSGDTRSCLLVFAVIAYLYGVMNLLPFVKLDGYIALMSYLDIPNLRTKAMADAQRTIRQLIAGTRERHELRDHWWAVPYGLGCLSLPPVLLVVALSAWQTMLVSTGRLGALMCLLLFLYVTYYAFRSVLGFVHQVRRLAHSASGLALSALVVAVGTVTVLSVVRLPYNVGGGYTVVSGRAELALSAGADTGAVVTGQTVSLVAAGVALHETVGDATVAGDGAALARAIVDVRSGAGVRRDGAGQGVPAVRGPW